MSGKKQLSILSFAQRGKPPKKARLEDAGPEKVAKRVGPLRGGDGGGDGGRGGDSAGGRGGDGGGDG